MCNEEPFELLDVTRPAEIARVINKCKSDTVNHLASLLSATGERDPQALWEINMNGLVNVLEAVKAANRSLFFPGSIAEFGSDAPRQKTPQDAVTHPTSIYGVSKVAGDPMCNYLSLKIWP